jgi:hypothetical protein
VAIGFENRNIADGKYYLNVEGNSGATNVFQLTGCTITTGGPSVSIDMSGGNIDTLTLDVVTFSLLSNTIAFSANADASGHNVTNCTFDACGVVTIGNVTFTGNTIINSTGTTSAAIAGTGDASGLTISGYEGTANTSALIFNQNQDPNGELDDCSFTMGAASTHAIEFGTSVPATMTLTGCDFFGYGSTDNANDSIFHFRDTSGTITLNLIDCTNDGGGFSYRTDGATINIVVAPVTTKVTCENQDGDMLENVRVFLETADNGGGSGFPYQAATSTLTQTGGTATLTASVAHGLATNDYVVVRGANDEYYNKVVQITVTSTTVFTYSVNTSAAASAGGTPVFSYCPISGLTATTGIIQSSKSWPASQGLKGWARKSTSPPYYQQSPISIADASGGSDLLVLMLSDE